MYVLRSVVLAGFMLLASAKYAIAGSKEVIHGSIAVDAGGAKWVSLEVPAFMIPLRGIQFKGTLTASGGSGNDIGVYVLSETQFINWKNRHATSTLFNSGQATAVDVAVPVTEAGTYYVVLDNQFSMMTPKTVSGDVSLVWTDVEEDAAAQLPGSGPNDSLLGYLFMTFVVPAAIGGTLVWAYMQRRKRKAHTSN